MSCFCWLYIYLLTSLSLVANNIINQVSVLTIWWCPCVVISCVVGTVCLLWPVYSLGKTLLVSAIHHVVLQCQACLLLQVSLDFPLFYISSRSSLHVLINSCTFSILFSRFWINFIIITLNTFSDTLPISSSFLWSWEF